MAPSPAKLLGGIGLAGAACFAWGVAESTMFTVRRVRIPILRPRAEEVKILHVSDIHLTARQHTKLDFIRSLSALEPDLIVNTGDNIAQAEAIDPLMAAWNRLRSTPGVFVFGSNDYYAPHFRNPLTYVARGRSELQPERKELPTQQLRDKMTSVGWKDLTHRREILDVKGLRIAFRGTDDAHLARDDYPLVAGPAEKADVNIGVTHAPYLRILDGMTADGMDLILAGHTHGGQVCVPFHGALTTNCDLDTSRVKGLTRHFTSDRMAFLHVSAGVGTSPYAPYRFACRPEVTLLTLAPAP